MPESSITQASSDPPGEPSAPRSAPPKKRPPVALLRLSKDEIDLMERLAPFLGGSPRRGLRFVNTYRVVKSSLAELNGKADLARPEFASLLTQLAVICGSPRCAREYFMRLGALQPGASLVQLRAGLSELDYLADRSDWPSLDRLLAEMSADQDAAASLKSHKQMAAIAQRYGFESQR